MFRSILPSVSNSPLKLESLGLVFFILLTCSQWTLLQLEEGKLDETLSHLWACHQVPGKKISFLLYASVCPFPTDTSKKLSHAETASH